MAQNRTLIGQYMYFFMGGKIAEIRAVVRVSRFCFLSDKCLTRL